MKSELPKEYNDLSFQIIGCAMAVHSKYGPGLLEKVYEDAFVLDLQSKNIQVEKQVRLPINPKLQARVKFLLVDLVVDRKIIIELKSVDFISRKHKAQLLTYLRFSDYKLGLIINFDVVSMKDGIVRIVNTE